MRILRLSQVREVTGLGRASIYDAVRRAEFPRQVLLGKRASGWLESEVHDWLKRRVAERDRRASRRRP